MQPDAPERHTRHPKAAVALLARAAGAQVVMKPIPNLATPTKPAGWVFGYMHGHRGQVRCRKQSDTDALPPRPAVLRQR